MNCPSSLNRFEIFMFSCVYAHFCKTWMIIRFKTRKATFRLFSLYWLCNDVFDKDGHKHTFKGKWLIMYKVNHDARVYNVLFCCQLWLQFLSVGLLRTWGPWFLIDVSHNSLVFRFVDGCLMQSLSFSMCLWMSHTIP